MLPRNVPERQSLSGLCRISRLGTLLVALMILMFLLRGVYNMGFYAASNRSSLGQRKIGMGKKEYETVERLFAKELLPLQSSIEHFNIRLTDLLQNQLPETSQQPASKPVAQDVAATSSFSQELAPKAAVCRPLFGGRHRPKDILAGNVSGGYVLRTCDRAHYLDYSLAAEMAYLMKPSKDTSVLELGAGCGCYTNLFRHIGFDVASFDGTPNISNLTDGSVQYADLSKPQHFKLASWVISLEVGEHIDPKFEKIFLHNIVDHAATGVVLSWAMRGQGGDYHVNELNNTEVIDRMRKLSFSYDTKSSQQLRKSVGHVAACCNWFSHTVMAFRRTRAFH